MSGKETNLPSYLNHPYDRFLALRVEFLILTQSELEAKIMRVIEMCIEHKRTEIYLRAAATTPKGQPIAIPDDIWVTIPHRVFLDWLQGTVQSETTLKEAINSLCEKHLVFKKPGGTGPYDAMAFTLNRRFIHYLYSLLPKQIHEVNMGAIMKQPRKCKDAEDQLLTPSIIDPLVERLRGSIIDPPDSQLLIPPGAIIDPLPERRGGQKLTPNKNNNNSKTGEKEREKPAPALPTKPNAVTQEKSLSFSLSSDQESLLSKLTDEQLDLWRRFCAVAKRSDKDIKERDYEDIKVLTPKVSTTEDMLSIYDLAYEGLRAFATSEGRTANPPELYNLVKVLPKWEQMQARKQQERDETRKQTDHIPGTGHMTNWTEARKRGETPPVVYNAPLSPVAQRIKDGKISPENLPPHLRARLKK